MAAPKMTKNQMRRAKKKEQKKAQAEAASKSAPQDAENKDESTKSESDANGEASKQSENETSEIAHDPIVEINFDEDPAFEQYREIFNKFGASVEEDDVAREANSGNQGTVFFDDDDLPDEDEERQSQPKLSKKKKKLLNKLSVAELKALVKIPEVVDWHDTSATDPRLLVQIKAQRNVVPVPPHWSLKREYLSSKRGVEKAPFRLPNFIVQTGITEMRDAALDKQAEQSLKQKQRERVQGKLGKMDIDYQKLYDAFFRLQDKPELSRFGEVYYEGKEAEVDYQHFRPGDLSDETVEALGIPPGAPPPWLVNQQRFGPPPSYPTLQIPGLNAPPLGDWGFQPGGWGKPPVDENNRPLYGGDVFGVALNGSHAQPADAQQGLSHDAIDRSLWGELLPRAEESENEESEEESDEEEEEDEDAAAAHGGTETPSGLETPGGFASTMQPDYGHGVETSIAGEMDLRKERRGYDTEESSAPRSAYTVLPERQVRAEGFFGSDRAYDISSAQKQQQQQQQQQARPPVLGEDSGRGGSKRKKPGDVDVALDPESLQSHDGIDRDDVRRKFDEGRREEGVGAKWAYDEDLSDMIAQESRKRQRTEKERSERKREGGGGGGGRY